MSATMRTVALLLAALPIRLAFECTGKAGEAPPLWPTRVAPVWPMKFAMSAFGNATSNVGPVKVLQPLNITWYYDYSTNLWREEYQTKGVYPYLTSCALFNGTQGTFDLHYRTPNLCIRFNFGFSITRPDSFVNDERNNVSYAGRECKFGHWADYYRSFVSPEYGFFDAWYDVETLAPIAIAGTSRLSPTKIVATNHIVNMMPVYKYTDPVTGTKKFVPEHLGNEHKWAELFLMKDHQNKCHTLPTFDAEIESLKKEVNHLSHHQQYQILSHKARDLMAEMQRSEAKEHKVFTV